MDGPGMSFKDREKLGDGMRESAAAEETGNAIGIHNPKSEITPACFCAGNGCTSSPPVPVPR